jgi:fructose-1-phosphate kinase PfkB-like protein
VDFSGQPASGSPTDIYASLIEIINRKGAKAVLDSSGEALRLGCKAKPFLIKPNLEEMNQITGIDICNHETLSEALSSVHGFGVSNILLSAGKDKSYFSNGTERWVGLPPEIAERNPTGQATQC